MPSPATTDEFLELVLKAAVVDDKRLTAYLEKLRASGSYPADAREAAATLLRDGILTNFQADQILQGRWKRFTIGKYKVLERLGAGGMGSVYLCEHKLMRRRVAVKVLPTAKADDPSSLERFYREARAVAALDHPNIVRAYDIDQDDKLHFLVMEHVDGASLQEIIKKNGPMDVLRACHYMRQAALGLQHAHETAALVHRDIKPGNILVDRNGIVKILDMGLARFFNDEEDILTKKYDENVLGTADYLAPEQATDSHAVDIRADIYSLGATFYFCLTSRTPFQEGTIAQKLIWHQTRLPKPIRSFRPEVPEGVIAVIDKAMSKDVAARYQSPLEMAEALSEWTTTPIPPPPENEMPKLSLAAMGVPSDNSCVSTTRSSSGPLSPTPRKNWTVPTPSPGALPKQNPAPIAKAPVSPRPVARTNSNGTAQAQVARSTAKPPGAANGLLRQAVATAPSTPTVTTTTKERPKPASGVDLATQPAVRAKTMPSLLDALSKRPWLIFAALTVIVLFVLAVSIVSLLMYFVKGPTPTSNETRPPRIYKRGEPVKFEDFLASAKIGDHILLQDDVVASQVSITVKHLTIEADPARNITWRADNKLTDGTMLLINSGEGLTLKGFTLDGEGRAKTLVNLYGKAPGLTLKDLQFKNFKKYGIHVTNCEGGPEKYIDLNGLTFTTGAEQVGLYFDIEQHSAGLIPKDRYFRIRNCKFNGPAGTWAKLSPNAKVDFIDAQDDNLQKLLTNPAR